MRLGPPTGSWTLGPIAPAAPGWPALPGTLENLPAPGGDVANHVAAAALRLVGAAAGVVGEMVPAEARAEWHELENKVHAFEWFTFAGPRLGVAAAGSVSLAQQVARITALADAYTALWAMEGLGYAWARAAKPSELPPREPRAGDAGDSLAGLPARAVVPLSTGSALAAAECLLVDLERGEGTDQDLVWRRLRQWRDEVGLGYGELAVEALGLVARTLAPWRLRPLDELLAAIDPVLAEYFWHGVGRGLYFAPMHLLPWSGGWRRAFAKARTEPPSDAARHNAIAGLAWALTLVNVRSPEVVEASIAGCDEEPGSAEAIANGISSALAVWRDWAGAEALLVRFLAHQPAGADRARRWRRRVVDPCRANLDDPSHDLRHRDRIGGLFHFRVPP